MFAIDTTVLRLAVALGIGLLIGIERERNSAASDGHNAAGVRTFTLTSLAGAISLLIGDGLTFIAFGLVIGALVAISYSHTRDQDPGMTTEVAQLSTFLLGGLAMRQPQIAAGLGVMIAILLASRPRLHHWVQNALTDTEIRDGLLLAAAALIILPLTPADHVDPWGVIHLRQLWTLAVIVMAINGLGYIALRVLGPKIGLVLAGFFSGFVSSTATIASMGSRARKQPQLRGAAVAGAAISSVASMIQLAIVIGLVSMPLLWALALPLLAAGAMTLIYAAFFTIRNARESGIDAAPRGRPFDPKAALLFVAVIAVALVAAALLTKWLGTGGLFLAGSISGLADVHAAAISAASLTANDTVTANFAALAVLFGLTANGLSKTAIAFSLGGRRYGIELVPCIVLSVAAAWVVLFSQRLIF